MIKKYFFVLDSLKILGFLAVLFSFGFNNSSYADDSSLLEERFDTAFQKMLDDPSDIDVTLEYANIAIEMNDFEAAIPPLERILFFNPSLIEIKLQLGVMYFNLKSYGMAKNYFTEVKNAKEVNEDLVDIASQYLSKIGG